MRRRDFLRSSTVAGAGLLILPSGARGGPSAPSNKLNIALIGAHGRGAAHWGVLAKVNVVALVDVNEKNLALAVERFPDAKTYVDWRVCLETQKDLDAVVICTTDHTHAHISNWAINRDLHVYCEKPLANSVEEARVVRANWLRKKNKLATQVGTQRHANENFNRVRELILDGAIGELKSACGWGNRQLRRPGYLPGEGSPPSWLHYDLWIGPSPMHPFNMGYFGGRPGANCLNWNMYWDFGTGQVGDMGSHTMDLVWNGIDAALPTTAEAKGEPFNPDVAPVELHMSFEHPANDWRGAIQVDWYQGGMMPESPTRSIDLNRIGHGAMWTGTHGHLISDFGSRILVPNSRSGDMSYYNRRPAEERLAPLGNFVQEWIDACKGDLKTSCDFKYSGDAIEQMLLGLVAYRVGEKLQYDHVAGRVTNNAQADALLSREYREGWPLDG